MSSLPIWIPFFSYTFAVARTSHTMLHKSSENRHPCLVPDHRGNAFSFSQLSVMLGVGLLYMDFTMLRYIAFIPTLFSFYYGY